MHVVIDSVYAISRNTHMQVFWFSLLLSHCALNPFGRKGSGCLGIPGKAC